MLADDQTNLNIPPACHWLNRWLHRRQRDTDRRFMLPVLKRVAEAKGRPGAFSQMWELFKAQPGQEHWHCTCAAAEFRANFERQLAEDES